MAGVAAVVAATAAVAGTTSQVVATRKQNEAAKRARDFDRRRAALENARQRRIAIAQERIQRASVLAQAENQGVSGSSSAAGAASAITGDTASAIGMSRVTQAGAQGSADALLRGDRQAATWNSIGAGFNTLGNATATLADAGLFDNISFGGGNSKPPKGKNMTVIG